MSLPRQAAQSKKGVLLALAGTSTSSSSLISHATSLEDSLGQLFDGDTDLLGNAAVSTSDTSFTLESLSSTLTSVPSASLFALSPLQLAFSVIAVSATFSEESFSVSATSTALISVFSSLSTIFNFSQDLPDSISTSSFLSSTEGAVVSFFFTACTFLVFFSADSIFTLSFKVFLHDSNSFTSLSSAKISFLTGWALPFLVQGTLLFGLFFSSSRVGAAFFCLDFSSPC